MGSLTSFEPAGRGVGRAAARGGGGLVPPAVQEEDTEPFQPA